MLLDNLTYFNDSHPKNAKDWIAVTLSGISIVDSSLQLKNAIDPIISIESLNTTSLIVALPLNAFSDKVVIFSGNIITSPPLISNKVYSCPL